MLNKKIRYSFIVLSLLPLVWIFHKIDIRSFSNLFSELNPVSVCSLFAISITSVIVQALRIWMLTHIYIPGLRFSSVLSSQMISLLYSIVLPSATQDIIRGTLLAKKDNYSHVWAATILCKAIGSLTLAILAIAGVLFINSELNSEKTIYILLSLTALVLLLTIFFFSKTLTRPVRALCVRFIPSKILSYVFNIREAIYTYRKNYILLTLFVLLSFFMQFLVLFTSALILKTISGNYFFIEVLLFIPVIEIMSGIISITPQGLGVREVQLIFFFNYLHLSKEQLGFYILILYSTSIIVRLLGVFPLIAKIRKSKSS